MFNNKKDNLINFANKELKTKEYNDEIVNKTQYYQNKFGFQINKENKGHEFWNNEADAFKHTFMAADLYFKYGNQGSLWSGMYHEYQTPNNPQGEWNMDSWNNNQGREIAKEIQKEYGDKFMKLPQQQRDDIIATKVIARMRNGQLITNPNDKRVYKGKIEGFMNKHPEVFKQGEKIFKINQTTGQAAPIDYNQLEQPQSIISGYINPLTGNNRIFTREEVDAMTEEEFEKNEKEIMAQVDAMKGKMPTNRDMQREVNSGAAVYVNPYTRSDGTYVKGYYRSKPAY